MNEIFLTSTRSKGDIAGVLESDEETLYFYLYHLEASDGQKVVGAINLTKYYGESSQSTFEVVWNEAETTVMVYSKGQMLAAFNADSVGLV